jgi:hypothetical protein
MAYNLTDDISRMLEMGQKEVFTKNFNSYPREWIQFANYKSARKQTETYDSMGNLKGAEVKVEGGPITYGKVTQAYQSEITNQTIANGFAHTMEAVKYDLYGVINSIKAKELSRTMLEYEENNMIYWFDNALTVNLADGVPLASNSHPLTDSALLNDTLMTAATIADPNNHKIMLNMFYDFKNHAGGPMKTTATDGFTHYSNMFTVKEIYGSSSQALEFSNTKNVLPNIKWNYSTYAANQDAWMMWDRNFDHILAQWFMKTEMDHDKDKVWTKNMYFNAIAMYNSGAVPNVGIVYNDGV